MLKPGIATLVFAGAMAFAAPAATKEGENAAERTDREARAAEILRQMLAPEIANSMASKRSTGRFGDEMSRFAVENVYEQIWTRPGLSLRDRSLATIPMLIALGTQRELKVHVEAGLRNGLTPSEIEEVIYQASAYVGFPRASEALAIAGEVIAAQGASR